MRKIVFWYDREDRVNSWIPKYDELLNANLAFKDTCDYWYKCLGIVDYVEPLNKIIDIETRLLSDWEENDYLNIYVLSIQQLGWARYFGLGNIVADFPDFTKKLLKEKKLKLLILNHREGWPAEQFISQIEERLNYEYNNMHDIDVYVATANMYIDKKKWSGFKDIFATHEFENISLLQAKPQTEYKTYEKKTDYLSLNRLVRPHRMALYSELDRLQLLDTGAFSFVGESNMNEYPDDIVKANKKDCAEVYKILNGTQRDHFEQFEMKKRTVDGAHCFSKTGNGMTLDPVSLYDTSYIALVTETHFMENSGFLTEKTFKSFIHHKPFLLIAEPGSLKMLRAMGYKTFPEMFDESYDNILDPAERFNAVMQELRKWCDKSKDDKDKLIRSIDNKVIHNYDLFFSEKNINSKVARNVLMFEQMEN